MGFKIQNRPNGLFWTVVLFTFLGGHPASGSQETPDKYLPLTEAQLQSKLQRHCTLVMPWASWCTLCLEEFPTLLPALNGRSDIHPIVLDLSRPFVQENFSRTYLQQLKLNYPTYRLPMGADESRYRKMIDPTWQGALPTTFLITCKDKKCSIAKRWNSKIAADTLKEVTQLCSGQKVTTPPR